MELQRYGDVAEDAARRGGQVLRQMAGNFSVREKAQRDLVTSADLAAQRTIAQTLLRAYPDHAFLGEEGSARPDAAAPFRWIVDPLDGTTNYVHGIPYYAVSVALECHGELVVGVIYDPVADRCFRAAAGAGAYLNGQAIRVSEVDRLSEALIGTGFPPGRRCRADLLELFGRLSAASHAVRRLGSTALNLAYTACGRFDAYYSATVNSWDVAAGVVILREAGGCVTNLDGTPYDLYTPDILATNGRIHDAMLSHTRRS